MLLAIDAGNTNVVFALVDDGTIRARWRIATEARRTADEYAAPGLNLSLDALVAAAAKLPRIAIEAPASRSVIGCNTVDQMQIGIFWGYVALVEGLVARMRAEIGRPATVVATGGLAALLAGHTDVFDALEPDLTVQGLAILAARAHM